MMKCFQHRDDLKPITQFSKTVKINQEDSDHADDAHCKM